MKILSLDSSTKKFSVAVAGDSKILASKNIVFDKALSQSIIPVIEGVLKKSGLSLKKIEGFVVGLGPGSFTSLRVGLATLKGLSFVAQKPVVGIASLDAIAWGVREKEAQVCVIQDARRSLVYGSYYKKSKKQLHALTSYSLLTIDEFLALNPCKKKVLFTGDAVSKYREKIEDWAITANIQAVFDARRDTSPQAKDLAALSLDSFKNKKFQDVSQIIPLYLYPADCQVRR